MKKAGRGPLKSLLLANYVATRFPNTRPKLRNDILKGLIVKDLRAHFKTDVLPYDGLPRPSFPEDFQNRRPWKAIVQGFEMPSNE